MTSFFTVTRDQLHQIARMRKWQRLFSGRKVDSWNQKRRPDFLTRLEFKKVTCPPLGKPSGRHTALWVHSVWGRPCQRAASLELLCPGCSLLEGLEKSPYYISNVWSTCSIYLSPIATNGLSTYVGVFLRKVFSHSFTVKMIFAKWHPRKVIFLFINLVHPFMRKGQ